MNRDLNVLQHHIDKINAEHANSVFQLADAEHFAKYYDITTVEEFEKYMLIEAFHNVYKDRNGFRPRGNYTLEYMREYLDNN